MTPSTSRTRKRAAIATALVIALTGGLSVVMGAPAFATNTSNPNDAPYWEAIYGVDCTKYDPPGTVNNQGYLVDDNKAVMLYAGTWTALIVKSGNEDVGFGAGNAVFENPVAGTAYYGPLNNGGQQGTVSHWIVCGTPAPLVATASISIDPATCDVGERLVYGAITNAGFSGTANGTTGPASYNVVATRTSTATFLSGNGVISPDGTTQTFEGTLSGPLDPNEHIDCRGPVPPDKLTFSDGEPYWECITPGVLRPAEISFVRTHYKAVASWTGIAYEYGAPVFDYDEVITIPTPESFDATCPPTVLPLPAALTAKPATCDNNGVRVDPIVGEHQSFAWDGPSTTGINTGTFTAETGWTYPDGTTLVLSVNVPTKLVLECIPLLALTGAEGTHAWMLQNWPLVMIGLVVLVIAGILMLAWGRRTVS